MKKTVLALAIVIFFGSMFMGIGQAYDKERPAQEIPTIGQWHTYVRVVTIGIAEGLYVGDDGKYRSRKAAFQLEGSGFVYRSGFILTAAHVVEPNVVETISSQVGSWVAEPV